MRWAARLILVLLALPAWADSRCARLGQPAYSALRAIAEGDAPPVLAQVTVAGPRLRMEARGPGEARFVTLMTPELHAIFRIQATPPVAMRLPSPVPPNIPDADRRVREERGAGLVTLITELRGASGQWHEVERSLCRRDGVLLEARQWLPRAGGGGVTLVTRQTQIRTIRPNPALFMLPAGFRLIEAPPAAAISRRIAPPPG